VSGRSYLIAGYVSGDDDPVMRIRHYSPKEAIESWREALETAGHEDIVASGLVQLWTEELMAGKDTLAVMDPGLAGYHSITIEQR
jgi:hypothetical protein